MADRYEAFQAIGVGVVAVAMSRPKVLAEYLERQPWPFPLLCDPDRKAYAAFGLGRTSWQRILRPSVVWKYLRLIFGGWRIRRIADCEDALQLGGDFLVARDGHIVWAYRSADPADRPPVAEMLKAARTAMVPD